ncbi:MAG: hypothetical protein H6727_08885 [Myxococcales bacterium]|nr:hypothetical protein [Myxococcales bacterium]
MRQKMLCLFAVLWMGWCAQVPAWAETNTQSAEGVLSLVQLRRLDSLITLLKDLSRRGLIEGVPTQRIDQVVGYLNGNIGKMLGIQWQRGFTMTVMLAKEPFSAPIDALKLPKGLWSAPLKRLRLAIQLPAQTSFWMKFTLRRVFAASKERLHFFEEAFGGTISFWLLGRRGPAWVLVLHNSRLVLCPLPHREVVFQASGRRRLWSDVLRPLLNQLSSHTSLRGRLWLEDRVQSNAQVAFFVHPPTLAAWMKEPLWGRFQKRKAWDILRLQLQRYRALLGALFLDAKQVQFQELVIPDERTLGQQQEQQKALAKKQSLQGLWPLLSEKTLFVSLQGQARKKTSLPSLLAELAAAPKEKASQEPLGEKPLWWPLLQKRAEEKALLASFQKALGEILSQRGLLVGGGWIWQQDVAAQLLQWFAQGRRLLWIEPGQAAKTYTSPKGLLMAGRWSPWQRKLWESLLHKSKGVVEAPLGRGLPMQENWPLRVWWPSGQRPLALAWNEKHWFLSNDLRLLGTLLWPSSHKTKKPNDFPEGSLLKQEAWQDALISRAQISFLLGCFLSPKQLQEIPMLAYAKSLEIGSRLVSDAQELRYHLFLSPEDAPKQVAPDEHARRKALCPQALPVWRLVWLDALAPLQRSFAWQIIRPLAPSLRRVILQIANQL